MFVEFFQFVGVVNELMLQNEIFILNNKEA
jgi:hypothetical protein